MLLKHVYVYMFGITCLLLNNTSALELLFIPAVGLLKIAKSNIVTVLLKYTSLYIIIRYKIIIILFQGYSLTCKGVFYGF